MNQLDEARRLLIIDDGDDANDHKKGYDTINKYAPFHIDRAYHFNENTGNGKSGLEFVIERRYDLILLDKVFHQQSEQGEDILEAIRAGFAMYPDIPDERRRLNSDTIICGISQEWTEHDSEWARSPWGKGLDWIIKSADDLVGAHLATSCMRGQEGVRHLCLRKMCNSEAGQLNRPAGNSRNRKSTAGHLHLTGIF